MLAVTNRLDEIGIEAKLWIHDESSNPDARLRPTPEYIHRRYQISMNFAIAKEHHYTVSEVAKLWHVSPNKVRRLFAGEVGVIRFGREETRSKRSNIHVRIPESVMQRVHNQLTIQ